MKKVINEIADQSTVEEIIAEDGVQNSESSSEIISNKITEKLVAKRMMDLYNFL